MPVQPIRLFGDPVLRTPGRAGDGLRQGAAAARLGPDRHDAGGARRRAGRPADRGRPAGLHLARRRRAGSPGQPHARPVRGGAARRRGLPLDPGPDLRLQAGDAGGGQGLRHARRAGDHRGSRAARPGHPARDRPPRRGAVHRPARPRDPQAGDEGDPRGRVVRRSDAHREGLPAPHERLRRSGTAEGLVRSRGPRRRRCRRWRRWRRAATSWSRSSPAPTPRPVAAGKLVASPVAQRAEELGVPVLKPEHPRDPAFQAELAALAPDCCPVVAYGAMLPRSALDIPRHGWVNLHFSVLPAWRGAAPVQHALWAGDEVTGATTFRIVPALDAGPTFGVMTERVRAHRHVRRPAGTARRGRRRPAREHARRHRGRHAGGPRAAGRRHHAWPPRSRWPTPRWTGTGRPCAIDRQVRACTPAPGAWTTYDGERLKLGPVRPGARAPAGAGRARGGQERGVRRDGQRTPCGSATSSRSGRSRWPRPTGPGARGSSPAGGSGERPAGPPAAPPSAQRARRPRPGRRLRRARRDPGAGRLHQPGAAAAAPLARADRARRGVRDRAGVGDRPPAGHLRRRDRRQRRPAAGQGRRRRARRAAARHPPAPRDAGPVARRGRHQRRPGPRQGRSGSVRVRQRRAPQGLGPRPVRLGAPRRPRPRRPTRSASRPSPTRTRAGSSPR